MYKKLWRLFKTRPLLFIFVQICFGLSLSTLFFASFLKLHGEAVVEQELLALDMRISYAIYAWRSPLLTDVMFAFSLMGQQFTIISSIILAIGFLVKKHRREALLFLFMLIGGGLLDYLFKIWFARPRPDFSPLYILDNYSFPSGHSMNAFVFYAVIAFFTYHFTHDRRKTIIATIVAGLCTLLVGLSRVYLGVHYPTDVLAGYIAGFWWFLTVISINQILTLLNLFKEKKRK